MALLQKGKQEIPRDGGTYRGKMTSVLMLGQRALLSEYFVLYLIIIYFLILWPIVPDIATLDNISNLFSNMGPLLAVALGQTFVLIVAGIDLSQTAIMGVTSVVGAVIMSSRLNPALLNKSPLWGSILSAHGGLLSGSPWAVPVALVAMLAVGVLIGLFNGIAVASFRMPPFIVTLVSLTLFQAFAIWLTKSEDVSHLPDSFNNLGGGTLLFVPSAILIALILALLGHLLLGRTVFGRQLYAIGANSKTAVVSGLPIRRNVILAYVISGLCASVGAILYTGQIATGSPTLASDLLLDVIGATVIGGTSLFGGKGKVVWTILGVLFFVLLDNSLNLLNLSYYNVTVVKGAVVLLAALFNVVRVRIQER